MSHQASIVAEVYSMTCLAAVFHSVDSADLVALGHLKSYSKSGSAPRNPNPGRKCSVIKGPNSPCFPPSLIDASGISLILRTPPNPRLRQHRKSAALKLVPILSLIYSHPSVTRHPFPTLTLSFYKNVSDHAGAYRNAGSSAPSFVRWWSKCKMLFIVSGG